MLKHFMYNMDGAGQVLQDIVQGRQPKPINIMQVVWLIVLGICLGMLKRLFF